MTDVTNDGPAKLPVVRSAGPKFFLVIGLSIAMLLPAALDIRMRSDVQIRRRGIFKVPVYTSQIAIAARFDKNEIAALAPTNAVMLWNEATAAILGSEPNKSVAG